jgi:hypothetical protein
MKVRVCGKKVFTAATCCEHPEYNLCGVFTEGVENVIPCMPGIGGKATMCFKKTGDNCYASKMVHEQFGTVEWTEEFCDEGIKAVFTCKEKGLTATENWCRKVKETGTFKFKKMEGDVNAMIHGVFGPDLTIDEDYKEKYEICGDIYKLTVCAGKTVIKHSWKLDEETKMGDVSMIVTKTGVGKYKTIQKKGDNIIEWTSCIGDCGFVVSAVCHKTGQTGKVWMERYCEMSGSYKPISFSGTKEVCVAMGAPVEFAEKYMNDCKAVLCIKADGAFHCHSYKSSVVPMEFAFKLGEEFEFKNPLDPTDVQKIVVARNDNVLIGSGKGKFETTNKMTFTDNFLIQEYHLCGTGLCEKIIYKRLDCC